MFSELMSTMLLVAVDLETVSWTAHGLTSSLGVILLSNIVKRGDRSIGRFICHGSKHKRILNSYIWLPMSCIHVTQCFGFFFFLILVTSYGHYPIPLL